MITIGELLGDANGKLANIAEPRVNQHRVEPLERPSKEVQLNAVYKGEYSHTKTQLDPTDDLIELWMFKHQSYININTDFADTGGFLIFCYDSRQVWFAKNVDVLNANFIYRDDLEITQIAGPDELLTWLKTWSDKVGSWYSARKSCYILDNPADESYEVYYDSNFPKRVYGKATPDGMQVHKYQDRFHRDMAILQLDALYSQSSEKAAKRLQHRKFSKDEAIIISDGCWMSNSCASSFVYIDGKSLLHMTEGYLPSDESQAVLISEIQAALNAVKFCVARGKKIITYYYDNTSILNVFKNRKTEYIEEVAEWKRLLEDLNRHGYKITFIELHPKNQDESISENKALMFFHNMCDGNCRNMSKLVDRTYADYVKVDDVESKQKKTFDDMRKERHDCKRVANRKRG